MDKKIIELFFSRSENAIYELQAAYGQLCGKIAYGILKNREDTEECLNTSYLCLWNSIPPKSPESLRAYLCTVVRNNAFKLYAKAKYRYCEESFDELSEIITDRRTADLFSDGLQLAGFLNGFLAESKPRNRELFMARYYFNMSIAEAA